MAKSVDSTAINELIHLAAGRKLGHEPSDEVTFDQLLAGPRRRIRITTALPVANEIPSLARPPSAPTLPFYPAARGSIEMDAADAVTHRVRRPARETVPRPLLIAALTLAAIAFGAASYRWLHRPQAAVAAAEPAPAPAAPIVSPIAPPAPPRPSLVEVQLVSEPAGATVTLIDDGHTVHLGTTPLSAAFDPTRGHDLVFALDGCAPQAMHLDPKPTDVSIVFPEVAAAAPEPERPHPVTAPVRHGHARARHARVAHETGVGTLMVSSKPPCEIRVDGKPTGLTTPQRAIDLPAGHHRITLVNADEHVKHTFPVDIAADETTKLIENLMQ